jgi:hypothetical protein
MGNVHVPGDQERQIGILARDMDLLHAQHSEVADDTNERTEVDPNLVQRILGILPGLLPLFLKSQPAVAGITALLPLIASLFKSKPASHQTPIEQVPTAPVPATPPVVIVVAPHPPRSTGSVPPPEPTGLVWPTSLSLDLDLYLPGNVPAPFTTVEQVDHYDIVKSDGTSNLPIHGGAYLHAGYYDAEGPINFEQRNTPYLYKTSRWTAKVISSPRGARIGMTDSIEWDAATSTVKRTDNQVANFRADEYERTGGMDVPVHFPPDCDEEVIEIGLEVLGGPAGIVTTKPVRFPKIS